MEKCPGSLLKTCRHWGNGPKGFTTKFSAQDFCFTNKEDALYALALVYTEKEALIISMKEYSNISNIKMLGTEARLIWEFSEDGLVVELPEDKTDP